MSKNFEDCREGPHTKDVEEKRITRYGPNFQIVLSPVNPQSVIFKVEPAAGRSIRVTT